MSNASGRPGGYRRPRRSGRGRRPHRRQRQLQPDPDRELAELEAKPMEDLRALATELEIDVNGSPDLTKDALVNMVLQARSEKDGSIFLEGNLELMDEGYGFLRRELGWIAGPDDVYVSQAQVRRFALRNGDHQAWAVVRTHDHDDKLVRLGRMLWPQLAVRPGEPVDVMVRNAQRSWLRFGSIPALAAASKYLAEVPKSVMPSASA